MRLQVIKEGERRREEKTMYISPETVATIEKQENGSFTLTLYDNKKNHLFQQLCDVPRRMHRTNKTTEQILLQRRNEKMNCKSIRRVHLEQLHFPVDGYLYIVKTLTSVDGGKTFWYCGNSKYFKTEAEAIAYKKQQEEQEEKSNG